VSFLGQKEGNAFICILLIFKKKKKKKKKCWSPVGSSHSTGRDTQIKRIDYTSQTHSIDQTHKTLIISPPNTTTIRPSTHTHHRSTISTLTRHLLENRGTRSRTNDNLEIPIFKIKHIIDQPTVDLSENPSLSRRKSPWVPPASPGSARVLYNQPLSALARACFDLHHSLGQELDRPQSYSFRAVTTLGLSVTKSPNPFPSSSSNKVLDLIDRLVQKPRTIITPVFSKIC
jgi:hypothetical protein